MVSLFNSRTRRCNSMPMYSRSSSLSYREGDDATGRKGSVVGPLSLPTCDVSEIQIDSRLGNGSFCMVLKAKYKKQKFAMKCIKEQGFDADGHSIDDNAREFAMETIQEEARILTKLNHPHIVSIHYLGTKDYMQRPFCFLMQRLQEDTLETRLRRWRMKKVQSKASSAKALFSWSRIASNSKEGRIPSIFNRLFEIGLKLCQAIDYLHQMKLVHGDIKPNNIGFDEENDHVKLFDFGLSKDLTVSDPEGGCMSGSYRYMAPEVIQADPISPGSDVYSLSLLLWELVTLEKPHKGITSVEGLTDRVVHQEGRPCLERIQESQRLKEVLSECWKPNPLDRPSSEELRQSMEEVLSELQQGVAAYMGPDGSSATVANSPRRKSFLRQGSRKSILLPRRAFLSKTLSMPLDLFEGNGTNESGASNRRALRSKTQSMPLDLFGAHGTDSATTNGSEATAEATESSTY